MRTKRSNALIRRNLGLPPEDWQEAMDRGVFLLDEDNREFVEYTSPTVHLPALSPWPIIVKSVLATALALFVVGWLYSLTYESTRGLRISGPGPDFGWWFVLLVGIVLLVAAAYTVFRVSKEMARKRALVLEGRIIFAPIHDCSIINTKRHGEHMYINYDFASPTTGQQLQGRSMSDSIDLRACPPKGTVAAILYKSDRDYQAL